MPKLDAGLRAISPTSLVVNTLKEWKLACQKGDLNLVFPNGQGNVEWDQNVIKRGLWPIMIKAGVSEPTGRLDDEGKPVMVAKYTAFMLCGTGCRLVH